MEDKIESRLTHLRLLEFDRQPRYDRNRRRVDLLRLLLRSHASSHRSTRSNRHRVKLGFPNDTISSGRGVVVAGNGEVAARGTRKVVEQRVKGRVDKVISRSGLKYKQRVGVSNVRSSERARSG
jgi:hypothetical protein